MNAREAVLAIADFLDETAELAVHPKMKGTPRRLTPEEIKVRLVDSANVLREVVR